MASYEDIELATQRVNDALEQSDLQKAKEGIAELEELERTFEEVRRKARTEEQKETAEGWYQTAREALTDVRERYNTLELEMLDPKYQERKARREAERRAREEAEHEQAMQALSGLGGFGQALAGLASLGRPAKSTPPPSSDAGPEKVCGSCSTSNPQRAKFCMECGQALKRACSNCGADLGKAKFCPECGTKA